MGRTRTTRMDEDRFATASAAQLKLIAWLSPSFPVGSFAFSHGLEWAAEAGDLPHAAALRGWIDDLLRYGAPRADAVLLSLAYRRPEQLADLNDLALALAPSLERRLESAAQGTAFLTAVAAAWPHPDLEETGRVHADLEVAYPVALGFAAAAHRLPLRATAEAFLFATVGNLVSAALRLGLIGQSGGQAIIAASVPTVGMIAGEAIVATRDDLGTCAWRSDIAAMRHETQYSRLFRS